MAMQLPLRKSRGHSSQQMEIKCIKFLKFKRREKIGKTREGSEFGQGPNLSQRPSTFIHDDAG